MSAANLSPATLEDLKRRHVAFLKSRLVSEQARRDWIRAFAGAFEHILALRIRVVLRPATIADALARALRDDSARTFFAPAARDVQRHVLGALAAEQTSLGDYVPEDARRAIDSLLEKRDLVPDSLVRKVFEQQAIVDAIDDTLYDGLMQFNTSVNPFFADWGLPSFIKRMPIGAGMILASMEALRGEFDRRLEPEIRKFLSAFSRRATGQLTELFITKSGEPKFIELRKNIAAFLYSQSLAELLSGVDHDDIATGALAAERLMLDAQAGEKLAASLRRILESFLIDRGDATVREWLGEIGATERPDVERWAAGLWPWAEQVLRSPALGEYLERITAEFYDTMKR